MRRLGAAMVEKIRRIDAEAKFAVIEAVPAELAEAIADSWDSEDPRLPTLAVASAEPARFGRYGLAESSAAGLRNINPNGVCIVVCEGYSLAERQSINGFVPFSPGDLLASKNDLMILSEAWRPVRRDGPLAAVRDALVTLPAGERPSASQVSAYFDAVADGSDPMEALPVLGGFRDPSLEAADVRGERISQNLLLASSSRREESVRPGTFGDIRSRVVRVLGRRRSGGGPAAAEFMTLLESGSEQLLSLVTYDEAREILSSGSKGLPAVVKAELADYRRQLRDEGRSWADALPWDDYEASADSLDRAAERRAGAANLLSFDASEKDRALTASTRRKLAALLRDRSIRATPGSALEVGLARAIRSLEGSPERLVLVDPHPAPAGTQSSARDWLTLACARVRLGGLLEVLEQSGCEVDGILALDAFEGVDDQEVGPLFIDAGLDRTGLAAAKFKLFDGAGSVEVLWAPDADDVALLRSLWEFSNDTALSFDAGGPPTPQALAGAQLAARPVPDTLRPMAEGLRKVSRDALHDGLGPERLRRWVSDWTASVAAGRGFRSSRISGEAALAGCLLGFGGGAHPAVGMGPLAPLKAEWLADYLAAARVLVDEAIQAKAAADDTASALAFDTAAVALTNATASHVPGFMRLANVDDVLLPSAESRMWAIFGARTALVNFESHAGTAVDRVLTHLLRLQPEAAGHLRCLAVGPGAAGLLLREAVNICGKRVGGVAVDTIEIFSVGPYEPDADALATVDDYQATRESRGTIQLRYLASLAEAEEVLGSARPSAHFALFTGLSSAAGGQPASSDATVELPEEDEEVLFAPRVWQRPDTEQRILLMPPGPTAACAAWLRLAQAVDDRWPRDAGSVAVPELRSSIAGAADDLRAVHNLAVWVATLDRYATRDSLERALEDEVAILHQEQRLGADSPLGLVVSQKAGGPVDRAIGRSLRQARIIKDEGRAASLGTELRKVASQGYGILALEAAATGTGINELVGHVVGFSMLGKTSTPWPLPPGCRVVLVSLDEHADWFPGQKRADLLALAIDTEEGGVHGAVIEVKARRSNDLKAVAEALDQLKKTLLATEYAAYPRPNSLPTRIWLNQISEAVYAVARESRIRLSTDELFAVEQFRRGRSTLEWAGVGLVFGPHIPDRRAVHRQAVEDDWVPIAMHEVQLTQSRLEEAVATDLRELYTAEAEASPLRGGRQRRRPETGIPREERRTPPQEEGRPEDHNAEAGAPSDGADSDATRPQGQRPAEHPTASDGPVILGWDQWAGGAVPWLASDGRALDNGHVQIWGSSGAGKTQFVKMLLAQLAAGGGARFGVADFKNDYGPTAKDDFPASIGAEFLDMWGRPGAPYNPLAFGDEEDSEVESRIIEFRDSIEQAVASYQRVGQRQKAAIEKALRSAYEGTLDEGRWPTMLDLNREVGPDIEHILGDLTRYEIFADGLPLSEVVDKNVIFGLNRIPGNGQTTVLTAAFLLSVISLEMQGRPPVTKQVNYALVVDEAHRVSQFRALKLMLQEGRSKGLAVVLATQAPSDLPEVVDTNAQTRICFRLSDAVVAGQAARKLDPADESLPERIRTLGTGEAFLSLQGGRPRLLTMTQHHRDRGRLDAGTLADPPEG